MEHDLLTLKEAAARFRIGMSKAYKLVGTEWAPHVHRIGRSIRISREGLEQWHTQSKGQGRGDGTTRSRSDFLDSERNSAPSARPSQAQSKSPDGYTPDTRLLKQLSRSLKRSAG